MRHYDALVVVSFGGPEQPVDVMPFLENVTRGRNTPPDRLAAVAEHYYHFGGKSPINDQNRALVAALRDLLRKEGPAIPIYWGNRNWHPYITETMRQMKADGVQYAAAFITSAYGSYSGCRQYLEDIGRAQEEIGEGAPEVCRLPAFWNNPEFVEPLVEKVGLALREFDSPPQVVYTAHSVPAFMADTSPYVNQLKETAGLISSALKLPDARLVFQSRSGPPTQPWLEPDVLDYIREFHRAGGRALVIAPIGFTSDHMEVLYDLDTEAKQLCGELGIRMVRAGTVGTHPKFIRMIRDQLHVPCQVCAPDCCPKPQRSSRPVALQGA